MAELTVCGVEPEIVSKLTERAARHRRSVEEEHRVILRDTLLRGSLEASGETFEQYLRAMPDVGEEADFSRITGAIRDADLTE